MVTVPWNVPRGPAPPDRYSHTMTSSVGLCCQSGLGMSRPAFRRTGSSCPVVLQPQCHPNTVLVKDFTEQGHRAPHDHHPHTFMLLLLRVMLRKTVLLPHGLSWTALFVTVRFWT